MRRILLLLPLLTFSLLKAQNVTIKNIEIAGDKVVVNYDLEDGNANHEYLLNLYASKDNFVVPLKKVKGDVGTEIAPGAGKKMEWNMREEFGAYKGRISLEIRGKVFVPFVKIQNFDTEKTYKRGKTYDIGWKPGNTDPVHIELYKGSQRIGGELNQPNNGKFSLTIPSSAPPGKDYRVKMTDSRSADFIIYTDFFTVKPKIPLLVKIIPLAAVAGGLVVVAGGKSGGGSGTETKTDIPLPTLPK